MKTKKTIICLIAGLLYCLSIIPLLYMGKYVHPLWDDFGSSSTKHILFESKHFILFFLYPIINGISTWFTWQGTYSAEMLFALQPGAWIVPSYWITPFIIIGSITFAYILFFRTLSHYVFRSDATYGSILAVLVLVVQFQYTPYLHSGFYWFNGSIYYGFFYALMIIELSLVIRFIFGGKCNKKALIGLAVFVSGGNYSNSLINIIVLGTLCIIVFVQKKEKNISLLQITMAALIGFVISVIAPGNSVRAAGCTSMPPLKAILTSIIYATKCVWHWFGIPQLGLLILITPIVFVMVANRKLSLLDMLVGVTILFGLFAAQFTPAFYAMSSPGEERQIDMYYYCFYMVMVICVICFAAWLSSLSVIEKLRKYSTNGVMAVTALAGMIIIGIGVIHTGVSNTNSYIVVSEILSGRAAAYDSEYKESINQIISSGEICYVEDVKTIGVFPPLGLSEDPDFWVNDFLATYYGKERIYRIEKND